MKKKFSKIVNILKLEIEKWKRALAAKMGKAEAAKAKASAKEAAAAESKAAWKAAAPAAAPRFQFQIHCQFHSTLSWRIEVQSTKKPFSL